VAAAGLLEEALPGNSAKIRLLLDLVALRPARVLDVGCGDLSLWSAVRERPAVLGVDRSLPPAAVEGIERRELDARELPFRGEFDAVVSTQMLDDVREWRDVLRGMRDALRPGGTLLLTCDSGDSPRPLRARLRRVPPGPRLEELRESAAALGLEVESLRRYGRRDLKALQGTLSGRERLATLDREEAEEPRDPREWRLLYLRASRPDARSRPGEPAPRD
jgi:SAM-dependent methyltransferase